MRVVAQNANVVDSLGVMRLIVWVKVEEQILPTQVAVKLPLHLAGDVVVEPLRHLHEHIVGQVHVPDVQRRELPVRLCGWVNHEFAVSLSAAPVRGRQPVHDGTTAVGLSTLRPRHNPLAVFDGVGHFCVTGQKVIVVVVDDAAVSVVVPVHPLRVFATALQDSPVSSEPGLYRVMEQIVNCP